MNFRSYKTYNDYELIYQIRERDEDAYGIIYEKYHPIITKLAHFYYNYNKGIGLEIDDLYQEGMCGLEQALKDYNDNVSLFYTYVVLCVKREMERLIKRNRRQKHTILNEAYSFSNHLISNDELFVEDTLYNENTITENQYFADAYSDLIISFKYELPDNQAQIFELKINGFNNNEISELLSINKKSVDGAIRTIRNRFQKYKNKIEQ
jgi:RNA polymerase sigma factor, sigma-70 family